jgi:hypothetical protein
MRAFESSKGPFVEEIRLIQSVPAINPPQQAVNHSTTRHAELARVGC